MSHTPGPWTTSDTQGLAAGTRVIRARDGTWIGDVTRDDARLIAAAPELLEALELLVAWVPAGASSDIRFDAIAGGVFARDGERARTAIAKAKGEDV